VHHSHRSSNTSSSSNINSSLAVHPQGMARHPHRLLDDSPKVDKVNRSQHRPLLWL
jgi:hypothetical protein